MKQGSSDNPVADLQNPGSEDRAGGSMSVVSVGNSHMGGRGGVEVRISDRIVAATL